MVFYIGERVVSADATSETTLYVDPVAGNDGYDGTVGSPLQTIQEAVYRFIPPYAPAPFWDRGSDRTISVVHTPGMAAIQEYLHIPLHLGDGALLISAEEDVVYSGLVQSGSLVADGYYGDGYYQSHYQLNLTTSPLTAGELVDGYFVRPTVNPNEHVVEAAYEQTVIVNNTDDSIDIVTYDPGVYLAFGYSNGMVFDVVRPQIEWTTPDDQSFLSFVAEPVITMDGGINEISGFRFTTPSRNDSRTFFYGKGRPGASGGNSTSFVTRCKFEFTPTGSNDGIAEGSGIALAGTYIDYRGDSNFYIFRQGKGLAAFSTYVDHKPTATSSVYLFSDVSDGQYAGFSCDGYENSPSSNSLGAIIQFSTGLFMMFGADFRSARSGLTVNKSSGGIQTASVKDVRFGGFTMGDSEFSASNIIAFNCDFGALVSGGGNSFISGSLLASDDEGLLVRNGGNVSLGTLEISGSGTNAIVAERSVTIRSMTDVSGVGNSGYGLKLDAFSFAYATAGTVTISGTSGDALVGTIAHTWGSGDTTDATRLCLLDEV